jgi:UDP-glucose 4-epimerase
MRKGWVMTSNYWKNKRVVVLGGAALIGSHITDQLLQRECKIKVVDDYSSGNILNVNLNVAQERCDLSDLRQAISATQEQDIVIDLACMHGGRTYVDTHYNEMYQNLALDSTIFKACWQSAVQKVFFMSSACAYPLSIQRDISRDFKLSEDMLDYNNISQPDGAYGFSKLAGELGLMSYPDKITSSWNDYKFEKSIGRGFTVYGPKMKENHAIAALIAKTFIKQEPFEIYGDGNQKRNWTYVEDTARGIILATEYGQNEVFNIGTEEVNTPLTACHVIWEYMGWNPKEIKFIPEMTGPLNRIADASKAKRLLNWEPQTSFIEGIHKTIDWYVETHDIEKVKKTLQKDMFSR